jgi:uncharacterized protein YciI
MGLRWRSPRWPRWATTELHRFVTLLTLVFLGLHVLLLALDGYMRFRVVELLVPFANHYRPLWTGLGVVAARLALAVWASTWLPGLIGYRAWRRLHLATFVVYAAATVHGLQAGSDGHTPWALTVYAASALTVAGLTAARLAGARRRPPDGPWNPAPPSRFDPGPGDHHAWPMAEWIYFLHPPRDDFAATMTDEERAAFAAHAAWLGRLLADGVLILAGPTLGKVNTGIGIFEASDEETAQAIIADDPVARGGFARAELRPYQLGFLRGRD